MNALLALEMLLKFSTYAQKLAALMSEANAQGRDVNRADLDALFVDDDAVRAALQSAIEARK